MNTREEIVRNHFLEKAQKEGLYLTKNDINIIRLKMRNHKCIDLCPCDKDNDARYCISDLCKKDIQEKGQCLCGLYSTKKEEEK
jgi:ferredoxin-thioredoxin reductase catalytic subunit